MKQPRITSCTRNGLTKEWGSSESGEKFRTPSIVFCTLVQRTDQKAICGKDLCEPMPGLRSHRRVNHRLHMLVAGRYGTKDEKKSKRKQDRRSILLQQTLRNGRRRTQKLLILSDFSSVKGNLPKPLIMDFRQVWPHVCTCTF